MATNYERSSHPTQDSPVSEDSSTRSRYSRASDNYSVAAAADDRYSRAASERYTAAAGRSRRRGRIVRNVILAIVGVLVALFVAAFVYVNFLNGSLSRGIDERLRSILVQSNITREPFYMVLLGTDESIDRNNDTSAESLGGVYRTDTVILARVDAPNKQATLISMPRDTQIQVPGEGTQKLNAAYVFGGAELAVRTVGDLAGVGIAHFALIDMDGVREVVDALGGIEVYVPVRIDDWMAGPEVLEPGLQTLNGAQTLVLCRSRNAFEDYGGGDAYRAANQRMVIGAIARKVLASDPVTLANTVGALADMVSTDLSVTDIVALAQAFQGVDVENSIYTAGMPTTSYYDQMDALWYDQVLEAEWRTMMQRVDQGLPPTEDSRVDELTGTVFANAGVQGESGRTVQEMVERSGSISVKNGSGVVGIADTVAARISGAGYHVVDIGNADAFDYWQTMVIYDDPTLADRAQGIVDVMGEGVAMQNDGSYVFSTDFLVVVGQDYAN